MEKIILRTRALNEINRLRIMLNKKIAENIDSEEVLKISREIDDMVVFYYQICT